MTDEPNSISRRNVLAGLGTIGVGGALVGAGTSAFFSDEQQLPNRMVAGQLKLSVDFQEYYDFGEGQTPIDAFPDTEETESGVQDSDYYEEKVCDEDFLNEDPLESEKYRTDNEWTTPGDPLINLDDIKPGDCGEVTLSYHLCDNPGWIWFRTKNKEYPGLDAEDELHLVDAIQARVWYDEFEGEHDGEDIERGDNVYQEGKEPVIAQGSLRDVLEELNETNGGLLLDSDPLVEPDTNEHNKIDDCIELETIDDDREDVDDVQQYLRDLYESGDQIELEGSDGETIRITVTGLIYQDANDPTSDVVGFDWKSNYGICQTRVKGGPDDQFTVENCTFEGTAVAPLGAGQGGTKRYGVSNFQFWYCKGVDEPKDPECFEASTTHYIGFEWCLPKVIGNDVQNDELEFDFGFYTEQCRHNDDPENPWLLSPTELSLDLHEQFYQLQDITVPDPFILEVTVEEDGDPFTGEITANDHGGDEFVWVTNHYGTFDETPEDRYGAHVELDFDDDGQAEIRFGNAPDVDVNYQGMDVNEVTENIEVNVDEVIDGLEVTRLVMKE